MVADALIYHPAVAHYNRFVATTSMQIKGRVKRTTNKPQLVATRP